MLKHHIASICLALLATAAQAAPAETNAERVVRLTAALEQAPESATAADDRAWMVRWLTRTPDYAITVCDLLGPIPAERVPHGQELLGQMIFGNAAFQIRHGRGTDELSRQVAGLQSVLRAYAVLLRTDAANRIPYLDDLQAAEQQGQLAQRMAPKIATACRD